MQAVQIWIQYQTECSTGPCLRTEGEPRAAAAAEAAVMAALMALLSSEAEVDMEEAVGVSFTACGLGRCKLARARGRAAGSLYLQCRHPWRHSPLH